MWKSDAARCARPVSWRCPSPAPAPTATEASGTRLPVGVPADRGVDEQLGTAAKQAGEQEAVLGRLVQRVVGQRHERALDETLRDRAAGTGHLAGRLLGPRDDDLDATVRLGDDISPVEAARVAEHDLAAEGVQGDAGCHLDVIADHGDLEPADDAVTVEEPVVQPLPGAGLLLLAREVVGREEPAVEEVGPAELCDGFLHQPSPAIGLRSYIVTRRTVPVRTLPARGQAARIASPLREAIGEPFGPPQVDGGGMAALVAPDDQTLLE